MPQFRYTARHADGQPVSGELSAANAAEAAADLERRGLRVERLDVLESASQTLHGDEAIEATERIAEITRSGLPLGAGLRALCEELPSSPLRRSLQILSDRLEVGESLDTAIETSGATLPHGLRAMIRAGARTNQLGLLLEQYLAYSRRAIDERREIVLANLYPAILLAAAALLMGFYLVWLVPDFESMFEGFGTELPTSMLALFGLSRFLRDYGIWLVPVIAAVVAAASVVIGRIWGAGFRRRLLLRVPVLGPMFGDAAMARFCGFLALLLESRVAMADAVEIAGEATNDAALTENGRAMADGLRQGMRLEEATLMVQRVPPELRHAFRWDGRPDALVAALRAAAEIFSARSRVRAGLMRVLVSPLIVVGTGLLIVMLLALLFTPMVTLLNNLS